MKKLLLFSALANLLILGNPSRTCAQSVGVSGQGLIPDVSALLDVDATGMTPKKGLLIPRISLTSTNDVATITSPANSLLVYNTGSGALTPAGYYYNQGTTVAANWVPFLTNNVNTFAAWSIKGNTGTTASAAAIGATVTNNFIGTTDTKDFVFATDNKERMRITSTGNIGIGTTTPAVKLELKDVANTELIRLNNSTNSTTSGFFAGSGNPEGVVTANLASIYADQANGKIYKKSSGSGNTGWNEMSGTAAHMAKMTRDAAQSLTSGVITQIDFDNEDFDIGGIADPVTNDRFNILRAGKYLVTLSTRVIGVDADEAHTMYLKKSGTSIRYSANYGHGTDGSPTAEITTVLDLAVNDYLEMWMMQGSGGALNTETTLVNPEMSVVELAGTLAEDIVGPASSTDNAIARFDGATGKIIQNSGVIIDDANNVTGVANLAVGGSLKLKTNTPITGNTTLNDTYNVALADPSGDITITLPSVAGNADKIYYIKKIDAAGDMVTIDGNAAETIDGAANIKLYEQYDYVRIVCDGATWYTVNGFQEVNPMMAEGRLTLTSGIPITATDVTAAGTVYFTPYKGNRIAIYDGSKWYKRKFIELSVAVPATTNTPFDIFIYDNNGTLALETVNWTNGTTRSATTITLLDGVYVKSTASTSRYIGTCMTTGVSANTEDSANKRFVWNMNNRVKRRLYKVDATTATWGYGSGGGWGPAAGSTALRVEVVQGLAEEMIDLTVGTTIGGYAILAGICEDNTNANTAGGGNSAGLTFFGDAVGTAIVPASATLNKIPSIGYHYYQWVEAATGSGTLYNYAAGARQSGMAGSWVN